jgi:hypothetical protein
MYHRIQVRLATGCPNLYTITMYDGEIIEQKSLVKIKELFYTFTPEQKTQIFAEFNRPLTEFQYYHGNPNRISR